MPTMLTARFIASSECQINWSSLERSLEVTQLQYIGEGLLHLVQQFSLWWYDEKSCLQKPQSSNAGSFTMVCLWKVVERIPLSACFSIDNIMSGSTQLASHQHPVVLIPQPWHYWSLYTLLEYLGIIWHQITGNAQYKTVQWKGYVADLWMACC